MSKTTSNRKIAIQPDPWVDFCFAIGWLVSDDTDSIPSVCPPEFQTLMDSQGIMDGILSVLWAERSDEYKKSKNDNMLDDLKEDWIICPIKAYLSPEIHLEIIPLTTENLVNCDAVFLAEKDQINCPEDKAMELIRNDLIDYVDYLNAERWRVFLYHDGVAEDKCLSGNEMCYMGELNDILPLIRDDLPTEYQTLFDQGQYEICEGK